MQKQLDWWIEKPKARVQPEGSIFNNPTEKFYVPDVPLIDSIVRAMDAMTGDARDYYAATDLCGTVQVYSWIESGDIFTTFSLLAPSPLVMQGLLNNKLEYLQVLGEYCNAKRLLISLKSHPLTFEKIMQANPTADETLVANDGKLYIMFTLDAKDWFYLMPHPFSEASV